MKSRLLFVVFISIILIGVVNAETCKPFCDKIGTRSEGWYDSCTGRLVKYDSCSRCEAICKEIGTRNEGWYSSCDNSLILLTSCEESSSAYTGSEASSIVENPLTCTDTDSNNIYIKGTTTGWDYYKRTRISNTDSCEDIPKYKVSAEKTGKILGLIPVSFEAEYEISAESGELLGKTKPWWTVLVFGESNPTPSP